MTKGVVGRASVDQLSFELPVIPVLASEKQEVILENWSKSVPSPVRSHELLIGFALNPTLVAKGNRSSVHYDGSLSRSRPSTLRSIFGQLCPRCRSARIFRSSLYWGFPKMNDRCPRCGLHFDREPGYFLGAMYISYGLALAFIFVLGAALWALTGWRLDKVAIWAVVLFLPFAPMLTFLSRVLWIYLDQKIDPEPF